MYGLTTVPERKTTTLPITLNSLSHAGFPNPIIFTDEPRLKTYGRWVISLWELFIRNSHADRYALFQDDFITYHNLRQYLDHTLYPLDNSHSSNRCYYNLITQLTNEDHARDKPQGWLESAYDPSSPNKLQYGKGAVALVFSHEAVRVLLSSEHMVNRCLDVHQSRRFKNVDGAVVTAMNYAGYREYIHNPSLVSHIGEISTTTPGRRYPPAQTFRGEHYDAMSFLQG